MRMVLVLLPSKVQRKPRRCRGCFVPFFRKKVPKNSPADASAYFVPANVRNGRLFAGAHAPRPRFLPLLAGPSFHGSGIGPESFAAFRGGKDASGTSRKHRSLRSPLEAVLNRRIIACSGTRTTAVFARKTSLYLFSAKSTDRSLRLASRSPRNAARKVRILACSGTRTTDSPRARSGRLHSLVLAAPAQRGPEVVPAKATCGWFWYF